MTVLHYLKDGQRERIQREVTEMNKRINYAKEAKKTENNRLLKLFSCIRLFAEKRCFLFKVEYRSLIPGLRVKILNRVVYSLQYQTVMSD